MFDAAAEHFGAEASRSRFELGVPALVTFDAAPGVARASPRAFRWIVITICLYGAAALALSPVAGEKGPDLPSVMPFFVAGILATELTTGFLLFVWTRSTHTWSLLILGCAFFFGGLISIFHLLTFPSAVLPDRIMLGTLQSAGWIFNFWYAGFGLLALAAIVLEIEGRRIATPHVDRAIALAVGCVFIAVLICVVVSVVAVDRLPLLIVGVGWTATNAFLMSFELVVLGSGIALVLLVLRRRNVIFLLLSLVLAAMSFSQILLLAAPGRYTIGWSVGRLSWLFSASVLLFFFMAQFARQQRLLVRSQAVLEQHVLERTSALTKSVKQRDALLRELHHRLRNKLQIVDALLVTQARYTGDSDARRGLYDVRIRVFALGLAHEKLMQSDDFVTFDIAPFLHELAGAVRASETDTSIAVHVDAIALMVTLDFAGPMGLLATELMSDCLEQVHPQGNGRMDVRLRWDGANAVALTVSDNRLARCLPACADSNRSAQRLRSIRGLVRQLDGVMKTWFDNGSNVEIVFPIQVGMK